MARKVSLAVNNMPINLESFVQEYIDHITGGIIGSLKNTGDIESLQLNIYNGGTVTIILNNAEVPIKDFPSEIISSTLFGMVSTLKGVPGNIDSLTITIDI